MEEEQRVNERIDELFEQAGGYFGEQGEPVLPDIEKFAELIIDECQRLCSMRSTKLTVLDC